LRFAFRSLRSTPGHTFGVVLLIALGIGTTTAAFSAIRSLLWPPFPYPSPNRLVVPVSISPADGIESGGVTFADYRDWSAMTDLFEHVSLYQQGEIDLSGNGDPESVPLARVTPEYFATLDLRPSLGRGFTADDALPGSPRVALLSRALWQRRFGGATDVVGRSLRLAGLTTEIVGVLPDEANFRNSTLVWLPAQEDPANLDNLRRDNMVWQSIARLRPGVSIEQARVRVKALATALARDLPAARRGITNDLLPLRLAAAPKSVCRATWVLFAAVLGTLLVGCVNVAGLLLARAAMRQREIAVRMALGASRQRLLVDQLAESLLVALAGGTLGLVLAYWLLRAAVALTPGDILPTGGLGLHLDSAALGFAVALSAVSTLLSGLLPAWIATSSRADEALRGSARATGRPQTLFARRALVVAEVAVSCTVLVGAGLLVRSFTRLLAADPGARTSGVLTAGLRPPVGRYPPGTPVAEFYSRVLDRLRAVPGVDSAAAVSLIPIGGPGLQLGRAFLAEGAPEPPAGPELHAEWSVVTRDYFRTMEIPILSGRAFDDHDAADAEPVIIVSAEMAARLFPGRDPIGKRIRSWRDENLWRRIVGVTRDVRYFGAAAGWTAVAYVPHAQCSWRGMRLVVHTAGDPLNLAGPLRHVVAEVDPELPLTEIATAERYRLGSMAGMRLATSLLSGFGMMAIALTAAGVFGLTSYTVSLRRREFGLRSALGARRADLVALVMKQAALLVGLGLAVGVGAALVVRRVFTSLLFETSTTDPSPYLLVPLLVALIVLIASYLPAHRISASDPATVLRAE